MITILVIDKFLEEKRRKIDADWRKYISLVLVYIAL